MVQQGNALKITTPADTELVMTRSFNAPRQLVFEALTKPEHIVRWLGRRVDEMAVCEVDLRVGGIARYVWRFEDGTEMGMTWEFKEITPPEQLSFSETFDEPYREEMGGSTANVFALVERDGETTLTGTTTYKSREERDRARATGMEQGASESFELLAELLDAGEMSLATSIDEYLAPLPADKRDALQKLRNTIASTAPGAEESISYGVPTFKYQGRPLANFGAAKNHCALYGMAVVEADKAALEGFDTSKGTIRFKPDKPLPTALVKKLVKARMKKIEAGKSSNKKVSA